MRIAVLGTCQVFGIAHSMKSRLVEEITVTPFQVACVPADQREELADSLRSFDIVVAHHTSDKWGPLSTAALRKRGVNYLNFPSLVFRGFHPDIFYLEKGKGYLHSPVSELHSALVAGAFLAGIDPSRVPALFNRFIFAELGYLDEFLTSESILNNQFSCITKIKRNFARELLKSGVFMHTINHPKIVALDFATGLFIEEHLSHLKNEEAASPVLDDYLAKLAVWPVYPEIAKVLGIEGSYTFKCSDHLASSFDLSEFITRSYKIYHDNVDTVQSSTAALRVAHVLVELGAAPRMNHLHGHVQQIANNDATARTVVEALYKGILKRPADTEGLAGFSKMLGNDFTNDTLARIIDSFIGSQEGTVALRTRLAGDV